MKGAIGSGLLAGLFLAPALTHAARAQAMDEMFEANLLVGYGSSDSYAFGFGARVGAWLTPLGEGPIGLIVGARGAWHSGNPTLEFQQLGGSAFQAETERKGLTAPSSWGPPGSTVVVGSKRIRVNGLIGAGFVRTKVRIGDPPFLTRQSPAEAKFLLGPGFDVNFRFWRFTVGGELIVIPMSEVDTVLIYGHIGGLWNG